VLCSGHGEQESRLEIAFWKVSKHAEVAWYVVLNWKRVCAVCEPVIGQLPRCVSHNIHSHSAFASLVHNARNARNRPARRARHADDDSHGSYRFGVGAGFGFTVGFGVGAGSVRLGGAAVYWTGTTLQSFGLSNAGLM
jgi:hypothetical protein